MVTFAVPAGGGSVTFGEGERAVSLAFPASAAGVDATISPAAPTDIGWAAGDFASVVKLEPSGTVFVDPIVVRPASGDLLAFVTRSDGTKGPLEGLPLTADGSGLELRHFSALVLVPPDKSCTSSNGWAVRPESNDRCTGEHPGTVYVGFDCKGYDWCSYIEAHCCLTQAEVDARPDTACRLGDPGLVVEYTPSGDPDGQHGYCLPCGNVAGSYTIASHCTAGRVGDAVTVTQNGCALNLAGLEQAAFTGSLDAAALSLAGTCGASACSCSGSAAGEELQFSCDTTPACAVTLAKSTATCTDVAGSYAVLSHCNTSLVGTTWFIAQSACGLTLSETQGGAGAPGTAGNGTVTFSTVCGPHGACDCTGTVNGDLLDITCPYTDTDGACVISLDKD